MFNSFKINSIYFKVLVSFLLYFIFLFFIVDLDKNVFTISTLILFSTINFYLNNNNSKLTSLYEKCDRLYFKVKNKNKKHVNLNSIINSLNEIEKEITDKLLSISDLEKSRSKFLGNVSHELKTPLFVVQGYIDTLLDGAISDDKVNIKFLKKIKKQTSRLDFLLSDLIKISMIESDELKLNKEKVYLDDIILQLKDTFKNIIVNRGDNFVFPDKTNILINVDKDNMISVFNNLITNAISYSKDGDIILSVKKDSNYVHIKIVDHGIGIQDEHLSRIFERFYRVDSDRSRQSGGTGLGLAIVKHILLAHNIKINIKSTVNIGTECSFSIPLLKN